METATNHHILALLSEHKRKLENANAAIKEIRTNITQEATAQARNECRASNTDTGGETLSASKLNTLATSSERGKIDGKLQSACKIKPFSEEVDDEEVLRNLFEMIATDKEGMDLKELIQVQKDLKETYLNDSQSLEDWERLSGALTARLKELQRLDFDTFKKCVESEVPSVPGRVHWANSLDLGNALARHLKTGTIFDGQRGIKEMTEEEIREACAKFLDEVPSLVVSGWRSLLVSKGTAAEDANSKFAMTEGAFTGRFASLDDFYKGVEHKLGQPNPKIWEGMEKEHCARQNASSMFSAPNYGLCTKPCWEWDWAVDPDKGVNREDLKKRFDMHAQKYPGEIGDSYAEVTLMFSVLCHTGEGTQAVSSAPNFIQDDAVSLLKRRLDTDLQQNIRELLESEEELCRGLSIVEPAKCVNSVIVQAITVPFSMEKFSPRVEAFKAAASSACGVDISLVDIQILAEKVWVYCDQTTGVGLRKALELTPFKDLTKFVRDRGLEVGLPAEQCEEQVAILERMLREKGETNVRHLQVKNSCIQSIADAFDDQTRQWRSQNKFRKQGRERVGRVDALMKRPAVTEVIQRAKLQKQEFTALRLYTGPLYILYNSLMRDFPPSIVNHLAGNKFETTMFAIISGITKLAKHTPIPPKRLLYRGLGGMLLPEQFWKKTEQGFLGGVEYGLMSTTADRNIAIQYCGHEKKRAIILEIQAGRIDVGASLGFLSQYAQEDEFLMQPLSCLEVTGRPRMDQTDKGEVLVVPIRVNVNLKSVTVEELTERRKILHLAMTKNLREELTYEAMENVDSFQSLTRLRAKGVVELIRSKKEKKGCSVAIHPDEFTVTLEAEDAIVGAPYSVQSFGKGYFEIEIVSKTSKNNLFFAGVAGTKHMQWTPDQKAALLLGCDEASWAAMSMGDTEMTLSCRLHKFDFEGDGMPSQWGSEWKPGDVIGIAYNLDQGSLEVSLNGDFSAPNGTAFASGVRPGLAVGAGLFPVFGGSRAVLRYNLGSDLQGRPMRFRPPDSSYLERCLVGMAASVSPNALGLEAESLVDKFNAVYTGHAEKNSTDFNDDLKYKELVNEVLDLKVQLLNKQKAIIMLCQDGATEAQLKICASSPFTDFGSQKLEDQCSYRWRDVFTGFFKYLSIVEIPLELAPCEISLVWSAVFDTAQAASTVKVGSEYMSTSVLTSIALISSRLQYAKYGSAVAGLVIASTQLTSIDLRGHEYSSRGAARLVEAVGNAQSIVSVNGRPLGHVDDEAVRRSLRTAIASGCSVSIPSYGSLVFKGGDETKKFDLCFSYGSPRRQTGPMELLDRVSWAFLVARLEALEWKSLNLKDAEIGGAGGTALAETLGHLTLLQTLELQGNGLLSAGGTALADCLSNLVSLRTLDLPGNGLGKAGWKAVLAGLERCSSLTSINGADIEWLQALQATGVTALDVGGREAQFGEDGADIVCVLSLERNAPTLTALDMSGDKLGAAGGTALSRGLSALTALRELRLGYNALGEQGGRAVAEGLSGLDGLLVLDLQCNSLRDGGCSAVAGVLRQLTTLRELYLQYNSIGRDGGEALAAAMPSLASLELLDLDGNDLFDDGCAAVVAAACGLSALRSLDLQRNDVSDKGEAAARAAVGDAAGLDLVLGDGVRSGPGLD